MGWLKKAATIALKVTEVVLGFGPLITSLTPTKKDDQILAQVTPSLTQIAGVIQQVELFGLALGLPGAQKLTAATPAVAQIVMQSAFMAGHKIADPVLFQRGCGKMADGMADILNSLKDDVDTASKT